MALSEFAGLGNFFDSFTGFEVVKERLLLRRERFPIGVPFGRGKTQIMLLKRGF